MMIRKERSGTGDQSRTEHRLCTAPRDNEPERVGK